MSKKVETKVTSGRNGGLHCVRSYQKACAWLDGHSFTNAQLWHLVLTGSANRADYETALDRLRDKLEDAGMPTQWKAAWEHCPDKGFHRHVFLLIEAKNHKPAAILRWKPNGWLVEMLKGFGLGFYLAPPRDPIHHTRKGKPKKYAYVPKTPGDMLTDCKEWISYAFKARSKEMVASPVYSSSRKRARKATVH